MGATVAYGGGRGWFVCLPSCFCRAFSREAIRRPAAFAVGGVGYRVRRFFGRVRPSRRGDFLEIPTSRRAPGASPARFSGGGSCADPVRPAGGHRPRLLSSLFSAIEDSPARLGVVGVEV